tara:strand:+ start:29075 stop:29476 length:402 start_codon:yes stop_codon:yes gene_type:complete
MEGGERMLSKGKVQTTINGKMVQDKEYGLKYDGKDIDFAMKDGNKLVLGRLDKHDISNLLTEKNDKYDLKSNLEKLLPKKKKKRNCTKKKRKKNRITLKIEEKKPKKKKKSRKRRKKRKKKEQMLKDFFNFLN